MKIGDYVRIEDGTYSCIGKIKRIEKTNCTHIIIDYSNNDDFDEGDYFDWNVKKSSPNIIDLIEVGDYVNGLKVSRVDGTYHGRKDKAIYCDYCENKGTGKWTMIYDDEIKSIVTKEQFEKMEYKIYE